LNPSFICYELVDLGKSDTEQTPPAWRPPYLVIYGLAALMVSNIPFFSLKNNDIKKRHPIWMLVFGFVLITLIIAQMQIMFFTIVLLYTLSGPFLWCLTTYKHRRERRREGAQAMP